MLELISVRRGPFALVAALALAGCGGSRIKQVTPQLSLSAKQLDFGAVPVLQHKPLTLTIQNLGRASLHVKNFKVLDFWGDVPEPGKSNAYALSADLPKELEIASGDKKDVTITFTPPEETDYQVDLAFESDDPQASTVKVGLKGVGSTKAQIAVEASGHPGQQSIDFGRVGEGHLALEGLDIHSLGTADLIIDGLSLSGDPQIGFNSSSRTPVTVPKGQTLTLQLQYAPPEGAPGASNATLTLHSTDPDHQTIAVPITGHVNRAPIASIADPRPLSPGQTVTLDGSGSKDPDGDNPIAFTDALGQPGWSLVRAPINSNAAIAPGDGPKPQVTFDLPGQYVVRLTVTDATGLETLHPAERTLWAKPAQALAVELVWDNADTDMDLHFLPNGSPIFSALDCWSQNKEPDLGVQGDRSDDPVLLLDALDHYGPEEIVYDKPVNGTYDVAVDFYSTHGSPMPNTTVTVRIYEFGEVQAEYSRLLTQAGQVWFAAKLDWPSGTITKVDTVAMGQLSP